MRWFRPVSLTTGIATVSSSSSSSSSMIMTTMMRMMSSTTYTSNTSSSNDNGFTYTIQRPAGTTSNNPSLLLSLYVPLTSYCNSRTLVQTRGSQFTLKANIVASLCRVRDAENNEQKWKHWCMWLDMQDDSSSTHKMPEPITITTTRKEEEEEEGGDSLLDNNEEHHVQQQRRRRRPTVRELLDEVQYYVNKYPSPPSCDEDGDEDGDDDDKQQSSLSPTKQQQQQNPSTPATLLDSIVIGGEGEPTLRFHDLIELAKGISEMKSSNTSLRLNTNGLLSLSTTISNNNNNMNQQQQQQLEDETRRHLMMLANSGIDIISIALMTHDSKQYDDLMKPHIIPIHNNNNNNNNNDNNNIIITAHERVQCFIRVATSMIIPKQQKQYRSSKTSSTSTSTVDIGFRNIEVTAIDRNDVNKIKTEELAINNLGIHPSSIRWRTYFDG